MTADVNDTQTATHPAIGGRPEYVRMWVRAAWASIAPLVFVALALGVLAVWSHQGKYLPTGDEPHYLVMADGMLRHHTLEQTEAYHDEFRKQRFFTGWPPVGTPVTQDSTHVVDGPHGAYNLHNVGLPALLAGPVAWGGTAGARTVLVVVAGSLAWLAAVAAGVRSAPGRRAVVVSLALTCSLPFLTAAGQVYPDLASGCLYLAGCVALLHSRRRPALLWVPFAAAALLPWLQVKCGLLAVLLVAAALHRSRQSARARRYLPAVLPVASALVLLGFNRYAYGDPFGPYDDGALEPGLRALQTATGLLLDQNHGLLFQNPLLLVAGVAGLAPLWTRDRLVATTTGAGALLMLSLNALHPNWYGGTSFSGRFMWTSAAILLLPAALALADLWRRRPTATRLVLGVSLLAQALLLLRAARGEGAAASLYSKPEDSLLFGYGTLLPSAERWLPALTNPDWVWRYLPNHLWPVACAGLVCIALLVRQGRLPRRTALLALPVVSSALVLLPAAVPAPAQALTWVLPPDRLPSQTGLGEGGTRSVLPGRDAPGFVVFGPGALLPPGQYTARFTISSPAAGDIDVAVADVDLSPATGSHRKAVTGTSGPPQVFEVPFEIRAGGSQTFSTRVDWPGAQPLTVSGVAVVAD